MSDEKKGLFRTLRRGLTRDKSQDSITSQDSAADQVERLETALQGMGAEPQMAQMAQMSLIQLMSDVSTAPAIMRAILKQDNDGSYPVLQQLLKHPKIAATFINSLPSAGILDTKTWQQFIKAMSSDVAVRIDSISGKEINGQINAETGFARLAAIDLALLKDCFNHFPDDMWRVQKSVALIESGLMQHFQNPQNNRQAATDASALAQLSRSAADFQAYVARYPNPSRASVRLLGIRTDATSSADYGTTHLHELAKRKDTPKIVQNLKEILTTLITQLAISPQMCLHYLQGIDAAGASALVYARANWSADAVAQLRTLMSQSTPDIDTDIRALQRILKNNPTTWALENYCRSIPAYSHEMWDAFLDALYQQQEDNRSLLAQLVNKSTHDISPPAIFLSQLPTDYLLDDARYERFCDAFFERSLSVRTSGIEWAMRSAPFFEALVSRIPEDKKADFYSRALGIGTSETLLIRGIQDISTMLQQKETVFFTHLVQMLDYLVTHGHMSPEARVNYVNAIAPNGLNAYEALMASSKDNQDFRDVCETLTQQGATAEPERIQQVLEVQLIEDAIQKSLIDGMSMDAGAPELQDYIALLLSADETQLHFTNVDTLHHATGLASGMLNASIVAAHAATAHDESYRTAFEAAQADAAAFKAWHDSLPETPQMPMSVPRSLLRPPGIGDIEIALTHALESGDPRASAVLAHVQQAKAEAHVPILDAPAAITPGRQLHHEPTRPAQAATDTPKHGGRSNRPSSKG